MGEVSHPHHSSSSSSGHDGRSLGEGLAPALVEQCGGRLRDLAWFRSSWQRGGAATGFARFAGDDGEQAVMVKVPVGPVEYRWTTQLAASANGHLPCPTPRVLAAGDALGGYDLAWLVVERLEGHTLTQGWCQKSLEELLKAAAGMQARATAVAPVSAPPRPSEMNWEKLLHKAREVVRDSGIPEAQRWNEAEKRVSRVLPTLAAKWAARPIDTWCHGDLHPGNAMWRRAAEGSDAGERECVLIDLALVHPGNWVEDAVYLERQFWGHTEGLFGVHAVSLLARFRRDLGLPTVGDYGAVANLRRVLMAACAPVWLAGGEGSPKYMHAALETIDRLLPQVSK